VAQAERAQLAEHPWTRAQDQAVRVEFSDGALDRGDDLAPEFGVHRVEVGLAVIVERVVTATPGDIGSGMALREQVGRRLATRRVHEVGPLRELLADAVDLGAAFEGEQTGARRVDHGNTGALHGAPHGAKGCSGSDSTTSPTGSGSTASVSSNQTYSSNCAGRTA
jgi:hypothetical protein